MYNHTHDVNGTGIPTTHTHVTQPDGSHTHLAKPNGAQVGDPQYQP